MAPENDSSVTEFILLGLTQQPELQLPLFFIFLAIYVVTVVGNIGLIILIALNTHLHTPMYYFLFNLSFIDLCHSSVITPKMLMSFVSQNIISYAECMTQLCFFSFFAIDECYILTSMAYDRYVAICKPLLYKVSMSHQVCLMLTVGVCTMGLVGAMAHTGCCCNSPSVMETSSITTCVTFLLCSSSPAQASPSMSWWFSLWWVSMS